MATALPAYESQLPALLTQLLGNKTTTSGSANTNPLEQVFAQALQGGAAGVPEMKALIESVFREGAGKVPELTAAFANATGSRTTGNSGLSLALGDLNRQLSTTAANAVLQNQQANRQIATNAAGGIANATKTTTAATKPAVNPLLLTLGGSALNMADKKGLFKNIFGGDVKDTTGGNAVNMLNTGPAETAVATPEFGDIPSSQAAGVSEALAGLNDLGGEFNGAGLEGAGDLGVGVDWGGGWNTGSFTDTIDSNAVDLTDVFGLKNGGAVNMANGGTPGAVIRNKNNLGSNEKAAPLINALNSQPVTDVVPRMKPQQRPMSPDPLDSSETGGVGVTDASNTNGVVDANPAAIGSLAASAIGIANPALGLALGLTNSALNDGKSVSMSPVSNLVQALISLLAPVASSTSNSPPDGLTGTIGNVDADAPSVSTSTSGVDAEGDAAAGPGSSSSSGGEGGVGGGSGAASSSAGDSSGPSYLNGGPISGPGTGTSDSIKANVSNGEYIFPADVVRFYGTKRLDAMKDAMHRPTA